ncbi:(Dopamine) receptor [Cichlidogyrus casuarinus]|uniref:(Dopamine) receptor n=1 Tax=Cichlidogyrus casuarinus TaxID=1844966 RepID=A0ABD2PMD9_9PLAT
MCSRAQKNQWDSLSSQKKRSGLCEILCMPCKEKKNSKEKMLQSGANLSAKGKELSSVTSIRSQAARRERKATKTLVIVLGECYSFSVLTLSGVFLFCWVPFFTINMLDAFCKKFQDYQNSNSSMKVVLCNIPESPTVFIGLTWLGYVNSFLNPIIYTIFNVEFRKSFKKLLSRK